MSGKNLSFFNFSHYGNCSIRLYKRQFLIKKMMYSDIIRSKHFGEVFTTYKKGAPDITPEGQA